MKIRFSINQISFGTLARLCGGELYPGTIGRMAVEHLCTDSREADEDTAFVALRGEQVDGHDYIGAALEKGCRLVICEHRTEALVASGASAIVVNDSELALSKLANAYRQYLSCKAVGITGSVGKTTTKDLVASVLSEKNETFCTPGNHNSLVGMPLSMLETPPRAEWSVLEMGMSDFGEIERLSITAEPQIAVITNIGSSHMETLGSRENICRAKLEILCGLRKGGALILSGDEPLLENVSGKSYRTIYVSILREDVDFFAKNIRVEPNLTYFDIVWQGGEVRDLCIRIMGRHNVYAALYAFAVGVLAGMDVEAIRRGLYQYQPRGMRQHIYSFRDITIVEDCYNASPESMIAAVDVLGEYCRRTNSRSIAVLGTMMALGADSPALHRKVGEHLCKKQIDRLFTLGQEADQIAVGARQKGMRPEQIEKTSRDFAVEETAQALLRELKKGDVVLFKASRAVGMERVIDYIKERL